MWQRPNPAALLLAAVACVASTAASADVGVSGYTPLAADGLCKSGGKDLPVATTTDPIELAPCVAACMKFEECAAFVFNAQTCRLYSMTLPLTWLIQNGNRFLCTSSSGLVLGGLYNNASQKRCRKVIRVLFEPECHHLATVGKQPLCLVGQARLLRLSVPMV